MTRLIACLAACVLATLLAPAASVAAGAVHSAQEVRLVTSLSMLLGGHYDQALADLKKLTDKQPDFRLANYLYGDLLLAKAGRLKYVAKGGDSSERQALLREARLRWQHYQHQPAVNAVPNAVLQLAPRYKYIIVVDLLKNRLYLLRNTHTGLQIVTDFYATIGAAGAGKYAEGDNKTPVGIYHVTEYKRGGILPAIYGAGAFPVNYPNNLDRLFGRTGYGIWIHGVPASTYNRPPRATQGCVAIPNQEFALLKQFIRPGITPVVLSNNLQWLNPGQAQQQRQAILQRLHDWRRQWVTRNTALYLGYYAADFTADGSTGKSALAAYMRLVNANGTPLHVELDDVSVFRYPSSADMALVTFTQRFSSDDYQNVTRVRQYWRHSPGEGWQIIYANSESPQVVRTAAK